MTIPLDSPILAEHAAAIRELSKRIITDVIEIGRRLTVCRDILKEDNTWRAWLSDLRVSPQTAGRFIQVYELSGDVPKLERLDLPVSAIYLLAAPSTPSEAREAVIERAQAGETVRVAEVKRVIERTKGRKQPSGKTGKAGTLAKGGIGADSRAEAERLRVRIEELQAQVRQRDITIEGLRRDIVELQKTRGNPMSISEFQTTIKKWEETVETQRGIIARLENENANLRGLDIPASHRRAPR